MQKIKDLVALFDHYGVDAYVVSTNNEYFCEEQYVRSKRLEFLTGFNGSNGFAIFSRSKGWFFTDGRYLEQCQLQLNTDYFQIIEYTKLSHLYKYIDKDIVLGFNNHLLQTRQMRYFDRLKIKPIEEDLVSLIWEDQPSFPTSDVYSYGIQYTGQHSKDKISRVRSLLNQEAADAILLTAVDSICWLCNIRASDVENTPLVLCKCLVTMNDVYLFFDDTQRSFNLEIESIQILTNLDLQPILNILKGSVLCDLALCSVYLKDLLQSSCEVRHFDDPCQAWKAYKNIIEIENAIRVNIKESAVVCRLLAYLDNTVDLSDIYEFQLVEKLRHFRMEYSDYVMDSFHTICGYRENSAIIHYKPTINNNSKITGRGILLIDTGAQYLGGTTDMTRTIFIGDKKAAEDYSRYYTLVLKGHLAIAMAIFPDKKITGANLDILARQYLWREGLDYPHGTGHGVGNFLSVHEGPNSISLMANNCYISSGMIFSNEPGYYVPKHFGIRIENILYTTFHSNNMLHFRPLTLVPYSKDLIKKEMLTQDEKEYLLSYYTHIWQALEGELDINSRAWLKSQIDL